MKTRILGILGAIALLLSAGSVYAGDPKPVKYHASGAMHVHQHWNHFRRRR